MNQEQLDNIDHLQKRILDEGIYINGKANPALLELSNAMKKAGVRFPDFIISPAALLPIEQRKENNHATLNSSSNHCQPKSTAAQR